MFCTAVAAAVLLFGAQRTADQGPSLYRTTWEAAGGSYAILHLTVRENGGAPAALAWSVVLDGRDDHVIVVTPGVERTEYSTIVGPLGAGAHSIELTRSPLWPAAESVAITRAVLTPIDASDPRAVVLAHAPVLGLRADTIGTASDLPLLMYVEDDRRNGDGWLRYSVIFSNEDGGTPAAALMARWGRTSDIELIYEVELNAGRVVQARYQGPDHRMLAPAAPEARPPRLNVITLNNMVLDRGAAAATVRPMPETVDLAGSGRERVMDRHAWIYRVMARELARERPPGVSDPRDFLYVDLKIDRLADAAVAAGARAVGGSTRWSDLGRPDYAVARTGEVRIAVPLPATEALEAVTVRCDSRPERAGAPRDGECHISLRRAFRLGADYRPGSALVAPGRLTLATGTSGDSAVTAASGRR